jgi:small GTP-binding protein
MKCKIVFLGENATGKTSIIQRYISKSFNEYNEPTIGAAFSGLKKFINEKQLHVEIWDTAGQERYKSLASMYYRGAEYAIIVFDMTINNSFDSIKNWLIDLESNSASCHVIIVGNKIDLEVKVDQNYIAEFMNKNKLEYYEVSAKTGENIEELFNYILDHKSKNIKVENMNIIKPINLKPKVKKNNNCCY